MKNKSSKTPYDYYSHEKLRIKKKQQPQEWKEAEDNTDTFHGVEFQENENMTVETVWNGSSSDI